VARRPGRPARWPGHPALARWYPARVRNDGLLLRRLALAVLVLTACDPPHHAPAAAPLTPCGAAYQAIRAWESAQDAYAQLLPTAIDEHWTTTRYNQEVAAFVNRTAGGSSGSIDIDAPPVSTNCDCVTTGVAELCAEYQRKGLPDILCDATDAHEAIHVAQCEANRMLLPGTPEKYGCDSAGHPLDTVEQRNRFEQEAYEANLTLVRTWFHDTACEVPKSPGGWPEDPCLLLDESDAATVLGRGIESSHAQMLGSFALCSYSGEGTSDYRSRAGVSVVTLSILQSAIDPADFRGRIVPDNEAATTLVFDTVVGVGDDAVGFTDMTGSTFIIRVGTTVLTLVVYMQQGTPSYLENVALAESIVSRI
jgi:hypothetical protein